MRIQEKMLEHGAPMEITLPATARYIQLIQLQPTDAARVGIRIRHVPSIWGISDAGDPLYLDLAVGDRLAMPFTDDVDGPQAQVMEAIIPYGPGLMVGEILPTYSSRAVFAFAERPDGSDLWLPHQRWEDVQQAFDIPALSTVAINVPVSGDFDEKNWSIVPCKGFVSGMIDLAIGPNVVSGHCISITELSPSRDFRRHVLPLYILTAPDNGATPLSVQKSVPFKLSGTADRLLIRVWRFDDADEDELSAARVRLFAKDNGASQCHTVSADFDCGAAGLPYYASCLPFLGTSGQDYQYRMSARVYNDAASATNIVFSINAYLNTGMDGGRDQHDLNVTASSAAIAPGNAATVAQTATPTHAVLMGLAPAAALAARGRYGLTVNQS